MTLNVLKPGVQTTVQGSPRTGLRHFGMPWSGPADPLSLAMANRLCGNDLRAPGLEVTFGNFECLFTEERLVAVTGADASVTIDGRPQAMHRALRVGAGERVAIGPAQRGMRIYLATGGGIDVKTAFGSPSTYLPGGFGGHEGRALREGDRLALGRQGPAHEGDATPAELRSVFGTSTILRVVPSAEFERLTAKSRREIFEKPFMAGTQIDRMGIRLKDNPVSLRPAPPMNSAAVFPGTIQCPEGGEPIILGPDAQTTGGYARILSVATVDTYLLGQITPRSQVRFFLKTPEAAVADLVLRERLLESWLGGQSARSFSSA
ncbi:5-oxoprolinase subunit C family protein [Parvularcula lutaonensis]|uniref:Biotin-dependent carboxyltransferase family protein n=1 Tax=Parvularcula lutaonensis TaxID=491923 RepID=A0ABV7M9Z9_9PROT|nr:biotin-dependent carboxyltransferase family protein [Parvularcula lutaonensis]GGY56909.1 allophanate hydrolase [Parvularcula lutaonensis]